MRARRPRYARGVSTLTRAQRTEVARRLAEQRQRTARRIEAHERGFADIVTASADAVRDDEHDPEGHTIAFERAQVAALLDAARAELAALDRAEQRLGEPDAGACARCGAPIGYERLLARPAATSCVECARGEPRMRARQPVEPEPTGPRAGSSR